MYYGEQDRVQAVEAIGTAQKPLAMIACWISNWWSISNRCLGFGRCGQSTSQTFTRPSGNGQYSVAAGDTPLDDTFHDTRVQGSVNWAQALNPDWKVNAGVYGSKEFDYMSMGLNASIERGFNKDNTTLFLGTGLQLRCGRSCRWTSGGFILHGGSR